MNRLLPPLMLISALIAVVVPVSYRLTAQSASADPEIVTHEVQAGESLGDIAAGYYGDRDQWVQIYAANRDQLSDPDKLYVGRTLRIPDPTEPGPSVAQVAEHASAPPVTPEIETKQPVFKSDSPSAGNGLKVGFIYPGPIGDGAWVRTHFRAQRELEQSPYVTDTRFVDSVPIEKVPDAIEHFAADGYGLIFVTGAEFTPAARVAARTHGETVVMQHGGNAHDTNYGSYAGRLYQAYYLAGIVGGAMTETNRIGFLASLPVPAVLNNVNAFTLGARSVNPDVLVKLRWTHTWYDPKIERETAERFLDEDVDVLAADQRSATAALVAAEHGMLAIGYHTPMEDLAGDFYLTAPVWDWGGFYREVAASVHRGDWVSSNLWYGLESGVVMLDRISNRVPIEIKQRVRRSEAEIITGTRSVFSGPLRDNTGKPRVTAGAALSDAELRYMDFLVEGVDGNLPVVPDVITAGADLLPIQDRVFHFSLGTEGPAPADVEAKMSYRVSGQGQQMDFRIDTSVPASTVTGASLHLGVPGHDGPIVVDFFGNKGAPAILKDLDADSGIGARVEATVTAETLSGPLAGSTIWGLASAIRAGVIYAQLRTSNAVLRGQAVMGGAGVLTSLSGH